MQIERIKQIDTHNAYQYDSGQGVVARKHNSWRQIKAMMKKHFLQLKNTKGILMFEILFPVLGGYLLHWYSTLFECDPNDSKSQTTCDIKWMILPFMILMIVPNLSSINARFVIQTMVEEKHKKIRETLRLMSLSQISYGLSFVIFQIGFALIQSLIISGFVFNNQNYFPNNPSGDSLKFFFTVLILYIVQIPFVMCLSAFFEDPKIAAQVGGLIMLLPTILYLQFVQFQGNLVYLVYLLYPIPLISAFTLFLKQSQKLGSYQLFDVQLLNENVAFVCLILSVPFWFYVYIYLDQVLPNTYGVRRHPCFCLRNNKNSQKQKSSFQFEQIKQQEEINGSYNDNDPILIDNLTKSFGDQIAVNNLKMSIKQGEIFTILGHNGAGKTTAIYMLTGVLSPTSGDATIYGNKISQKMTNIQQNLGLCQQFDVLFDLLTVQQHLELVCEIKNMEENLIQETIENTLKVVMLTDHKDKKVKELSGGMKRKLSLGMAIVTQPQILILDEPTSGLDVESRQQVWKLIKTLKEGRSIIMSSQHLEEADELADRICIMTKGQLLALDTPFQIKKKYGFGYKLLIEPKQAQIQTDGFLQIKEQVIDPIILSKQNRSLNLKESEESTSKKLIYHIPFTETQNISLILKQLDDQDLSKFAYIDIEINSLEDAYINIAKEEEKLLIEINKRRNSLKKSFKQLRGDSLNDSQKQIQNFSQTSIDIKEQQNLLGEDLKQQKEDFNRYKNCQKHPSIKGQIFANYKRRIFQFMSQPKDIILLLNPVLFVAIELFFFSTIINAFQNIQGITKDQFNNLQTQLNENVFPKLIQAGVILYSGFFIIPAATDRCDGLRNLLHFAGIDSVAYYLGLIFADFTLFVIPSILLVVTGIIMQVQQFIHNGGQVFLILVAFGLPLIMLQNLMGFVIGVFIKKDQENAADNIFKYSVLPNMLIYALCLIANSYLPSKIAEQIYIFVPHICLQDSLSQVVSSNMQHLYLNFLAFFVQALLLFFIIIFIDNKIVNSYKGEDQNFHLAQQNDNSQQNQDVIDHKNFSTGVWNSNIQEYLIQAQDLIKVYKNGHKAVDSNTFCVKKGEVLGLLGPNGAGKSSTFNIMTLAMKRSGGNCKIHSEYIDNINIKQKGLTMGICSQSNTIWKSLDIDQTLNFIGEVKGLSKEDIRFQIDYLKDQLDLTPFSKIKAMNLSGGNKRKLVCAMSLIGYPSIEFLDEPSTGVDPVSSRSLFKMLKNLDECSIILTTHKMNEVESLCNNVVIQVNGKFVCYGSPGHLKSLYGQGYEVVFKHKQDLKQLQQILREQMPSLIFIESKSQDQSSENLIESMFSYQVNSNENVNLVNLFDILSSLKYQQKLIVDFSATRASLEHVFVKFAKLQRQVELA